MLYFAIPLKSRYASVDWDRVSTLFNRTLASIYNQTSGEFRVFVACHDKPKLQRAYDNRLEFIEVDAPLPNGLREQMCDKGYKVHAIGTRLREYGGGYTMLLDADDLVSRRLADFVRRAAACDGWSIDTGYIYYLDRGALRYAPKFPGRTAIVNYRPSDLPSTMDGAWSPSSFSQPWLIRKGHGDIADGARQAGRILTPLPFKAFVYVLGTGENHSTMNGRRSKLRAILERALPRPHISQAMREEFGMSWLDAD